MVMALKQQSSTEEVNNPKPRRKSVLSRLRRKSGDEKRGSRTPSPSVSSSEPSEPKHYAKDGSMIVTSSNAKDFRPSDVQKKKATKKNGHRNPKNAHKQPSARDSAFAGPPRYDWIDIETAAAIKVQSIYRRNKVMDDLEREGKSTAQMRNRMRKRKAKKRLAVAEDTPSFMQCCGLGLVFGDATEEDDAVIKQYEKDKYHEKRKEQEAKEEELRKFNWKSKPSNNLVETVEVVDSFDEEQPVDLASLSDKQPVEL